MSGGAAPLVALRATELVELATQHARCARINYHPVSFQPLDPSLGIHYLVHCDIHCPRISTPRHEPTQLGCVFPNVPRLFPCQHSQCIHCGIHCGIIHCDTHCPRISTPRHKLTQLGCAFPNSLRLFPCQHSLGQHKVAQNT